MNAQDQQLAALYGFAGGEGLVPTLKTVQGADPAAAAEFSQTVPTGKFWKLLAVTVVLAQGATQTPAPALVIDDGTNILAQLPGASSAQNASITTRYTWAPGCTLVAGATATVVCAPLPAQLVLPAGYKIRSVTAGIGANSDYGIPTFYVAEFA